MMISLEDICPGVPITIDYGKDYVKENLKNKCRCGSFACISGQHHKEFSRLDKDSMAICLHDLNKDLSQNYTSQVPDYLKESNKNSKTRSPF